MLQDRLGEDLVLALKNKDEKRVEAIRFFLSQLKNEEIKARAAQKEVTDTEALALLKGEVKRREEALSLFKEAHREDLVAAEEVGLKILREYLPPEMSRDAVQAIAVRLKGEGLKDFPALMKAVMTETRGQADGRVVSEVVKDVLNG